MATSSSSSAALPLFWDLASNDEQKRLGSSSMLVSSLFNQQSSLPSTSRSTLDASPAANEDDELDTTQESSAGLFTASEARQVDAKMDQLLAADVSYSLRRLTRGLASPREQSRLGFAVALTELLARTDTLTAIDVLVLVLRASTPVGKVSRSEERNLLFARLFGVQALVRSGLLSRSSSVSDVTRAIDILVELGEKKSPLRESAGWVLVQMLESISSETSTSPSSVRKSTCEALSRYATQGELSPEKLAVLLKLSQVDSKFKLEGKIASVKRGNILSSDNLPLLAKLLRNAPSADILEDEQEEVSAGAKSPAQKKGPQSGSFNPRVHFVWDVILDTYYGPRSTSIPNRAPFPELYMTCVDESLFANTASAERKSWGFQVFSKALPIVRSDDKPLLFTPNFMRTWINQLASRDRFLHKAATNAAAVVQATVAQDPRTGFALTSQLMGKHGSHKFDRLTNTKTVENILSTMDYSGVLEYARYIVQVIANSVEDSKRRWGLDQLLALVRNTAIPTDDKSTESILQYLVAAGFFSWNKVTTSSKDSLLGQVPEPAFTDSIRALARSRFLSCLTELTERTVSVTEANGKTHRAQGVSGSGQLWISRAWDIYTALKKDTKSFTSVMDEAATDAAKSGATFFEKVRKASKAAKDPRQKERLSAFESLLLACLLYIVESSDEASDLLESLEDCYTSLFVESDKPAGKTPKAQASSDDDDEEGEEPSGIELLQDCLVGLLERPSAFLRAIAERTFSEFVTELNEQSLDHLVDQLGLGEEPAEEGGDDQDEEMGEGDQEEDEDEDEDSSDTSSDSGDVDSDGDDEPVDTELRSEVLDALRSVGMADEDEEEADDNDKEDEGSDAGSDVDSLPDLTDEQMLQVDDRLAEIFRSRVNGRKNEKEAKQDSIAFQNKILDLLAIFAKKQSSSALILRLVRPMFVIATEGETLDKQVATKASTILKNSICKAKDFPVNQEFATVADDFEAVHSFAQKSPSGELSSLANTVNLLLTRVLYEDKDVSTLSATNKTALIARYKSTLEEFLTRKASQLKPAFLVDAFKKFPVIGWSLRNELLDSCSPDSAAASSIKTFRQQQAVQMLSTVLNQVVSSPMDITSRADIIATMQDVSDLVYATVNAAVNASGSEVNSNKLKDILKLGLQGVRLTSRLVEGDKAQLQKVWKVSKIQDASTALSSAERFKQSTSLIGLFKQMASIVSGENAKSNDKKRKSDASAASAAGKASGEVVAAKTKKGKSEKAEVNGNGTVTKKQKKIKTNGSS
ncbi:unnamed protein product [Sympodiomycopsis kandeliae]